MRTILKLTVLLTVLLGTPTVKAQEIRTYNRVHSALFGKKVGKGITTIQFTDSLVVLSTGGITTEAKVIKVTGDTYVTETPTSLLTFVLKDDEVLLYNKIKSYTTTIEQRYFNK